MDRQRHHASILVPFRIETIELIDAAPRELLGREMLQCVDDYVVRLDGVGNRRDDAVRRLNCLRQIF
jgi:hypothetical protein